VGVWVSDPKVEVTRWFVFANGRSEYLEKYQNLPTDLKLPHDVGFLSWDHQGQGQSGGVRSHIKTYQSFARDCELVIRKYVGDKPFVLAGHSMGALISLYSVMSQKLDPEAVFLSSPLLRMPAKPFSPEVTKKITKAASVSGLGEMSTGVGKHRPGESFVGNKYTHCFETYKSILQTPYGCPGASFAWANATQDAIDFVFEKKNIAKIKAPVLIVGGSEEKVVDMTGWSAWAQLSQTLLKKGVVYQLVPGARHELFSEIPKYKEKAVQHFHEALPDFFKAR
jgi:alpha-beta hydrolase superfamily lysophospholipase